MEAGQTVSRGGGRLHAVVGSSAWPLNSSAINILFVEDLEPLPWLKASVLA